LTSGDRQAGKQVARVEGQLRLIGPLPDCRREQQGAGAVQHIDTAPGKHQLAIVDHLVPERVSRRACHRAIEIKLRYPAHLRWSLMFSRFLAQHYPMVTRERLKRCKATRIDIRIEAAVKLQDTIAREICTLYWQ